MKKKIVVVISVLATVLIAGSVYASKELDKSEKEAAILPNVVLEQPLSTDISDNHGIFSIPEYSTIQDRMLNAIDNFKTVKGNYRIVLDPLEVDEQMYFEVTEGNQPKSYVKVINNKNSQTIEQRFDGKNVSRLIDQELVSTANVQGKELGKPVGPRETKTPEGEPVYINRADPAFSGRAQDVILPQAYAFWLNNDAQNYQIKGDEVYLGRNATLIEGYHDEDMAYKHKAETFSMWVDSETGVLLKLIETNEKGKVTNLIEAISIEFNNLPD